MDVMVPSQGTNTIGSGVLPGDYSPGGGWGVDSTVGGAGKQ